MGLTITGLDETHERLLALAARARDLSPFLKREAASAQRYISDAWTGRRGPTGRRWPRDSDGRSEGSGRLSRSHRTAHGRTSMTISVSEAHAAYQFFGTEHLPSRNPLPVVRRGREYVVPRRGPGKTWFDGHQERLKAWLSGEDL